jgi:hypothetical protein
MHEEQSPMKHRRWLATKFEKVDQGEKLYYNKKKDDEKKLGP